MGLLDAISNIKFEPNPVGMGLLGLGAQMMQSSNNQRTPIGFGNMLGSGLEGFNNGLQQYQQYQANQDTADQRNALRDIQRQQVDLSNKRLQREQDKEDALKKIDFTQFKDDPLGLAQALNTAGYGEKSGDLIIQASTRKAEQEARAQQAEQARLAQYQQQEYMARLAASLRPPAQPRQDALVQVQGKDGLPVYVPSSQAVGLTPFNTSQAEKSLQSIPANQLEAQVVNNDVLRKIDTAIQNIDENPRGLGMQNIWPDSVLQRMDPKGVSVRASIADISGQKFHDLSGAAVSAAEAERLRPYLPSATDTPETAKQKLLNLRKEYQNVNKQRTQAFSKENGYRNVLPAYQGIQESSGTGNQLVDHYLTNGGR